MALSLEVTVAPHRLTRHALIQANSVAAGRLSSGPRAPSRLCVTRVLTVYINGLCGGAALKPESGIRQKVQT